MNISPGGIALLKAHEGLRLKAYPDPASGGVPWTIGYGHTMDVRPGQIIEQAEADQLLLADLRWVEAAIREQVHVPITQQQHDALCSFIFNVGAGAFGNSSLLRALNAGDYAGAAAQFEVWTKAAGKTMPGLVRRRREERDLFVSGAEPAVSESQQEPEAVMPGSVPSPVSTPAAAHPQPEKTMPLPAIIGALLPSLIESIPRLGKLFGSGSVVAERNVKAAELAVKIVQQATGSVNAQEAIERVRADPGVAAAATKAVEARWLELSDAGSGGIEGARKADAEARASGESVWKSPSLIVACMLLPLVYLIMGNVAGLYGTAWAAEARAGIAGSIAGGIVMGLIGYYYGQTTSRNRTPA